MTSADCTLTKLRRPESPRSKLLHHQAILHIGHAGAAVALEVRAKKSELSHGLDQLARKAAVAIALFNDRNQVVFDELARAVSRAMRSSSLRSASKPIKSTP